MTAARVSVTDSPVINRKGSPDGNRRSFLGVCFAPRAGALSASGFSEGGFCAGICEGGEIWSGQNNTT